MIEIYAFMYCPCIFESAFTPMSVHKTKQGAYKAMREYLEEKYSEWFDMRTMYGKDKQYHTSKFGEHEHWGIKSIELKE